MSDRNSQVPRELQRLAALESYDVLDTPREKDFDDVAELASQICEAPIAVVNLIGEGRQFFKAEVGLGVRETPLESSFCARAILEEDFLVVPDATKDPRFDGNPLVVGKPQLRFYAGALLKTDDGHAIGTVCVLDLKARELTPLQEKTLRVLARQVMNQLNLRRVLKAKTKAEAIQNVLNHELSHRLKNSLAMVQAIASQTLKTTADDEAFRAFERRIEALGRAHEVLLLKNFQAAPMRSVLEMMLSLHDDAGRIQLSGPPVDLGPRAVLSLSLLLHELATNAAKYGALSSVDGSVAIDWGIDGEKLTINWRESGGPPVTPPAKKGFGSKLIRLGLSGNRNTTVEYDPAGIRVTMTAAIQELKDAA